MRIKRPCKYINAAPTVGDDNLDGYSEGWLWINSTNGDLYVCISAATGAANWVQIGGGGGSGTVDTIVGSADIDVDSTDPSNPELSIIADRFVRALVAGSGVSIDDTDPENPIIDATGGGSLALEYPIIAMGMNADTLTIAGAAGNNSRGMSFSPLTTQQIIGAKFYSNSATSRNIKLSLWDHANTRVANETVVVNSTGVQTVTFSSPYTTLSTDLGKIFKLSVWDTGGVGASTIGYITTANWGSTRLPPKNVPLNPGLIYRTNAFYNGLTGDLVPNTEDTASIYLIEPRYQ